MSEWDAEPIPPPRRTNNQLPHPGRQASGISGSLRLLKPSQLLKCFGRYQTRCPINEEAMYVARRVEVWVENVLAAVVVPGVCSSNALRRAD